MLRTSTAAALLILLLGMVGLGQQRDAGLPPLEYTCPHHGDHVQAKPGTCPMPMEGAPGGICKMQLVPVRIEPDLWYTCPVHANVPNVLGRTPGVCPIDRRPKMPVGVTVYWRCRQSPDEKLMEPGRCGDGTAREAVREVRAHGDHNPRHGGSFFMAPDAWHHVEGTYPRAGLFRVYFYDNFTQPLDAKAFAARLVLREEFDTATSTLKELEVVPLKPGSEINALDAPLKGDKLPLKVTVKVKFTTDGREYRFDFGFAEYSIDSAAKR